MIKVGIVGGTGYTGVELLRLLATHPQVQLMAVTSRKEDGMPIADMYPSLRGRVALAFSSPEKAQLTECDVVFFATPHGVAMAQAPELLAAGVKVIDLAADFRSVAGEGLRRVFGIDGHRLRMQLQHGYGGRWRSGSNLLSVSATAGGRQNGN